MASPLGLWLLCVVHLDAHHDVQPLINPDRYPDATAIQHHLLDELIPATIRTRPPHHHGQDPLRPRRQHNPEQLRRWLTTLAIELRNAHTRDWRWWQLARHTLTTRPIRLASRLAYGLVALLLYGLVKGLVYGLIAGLALGLMYGLMCLLLSWLAGWSMFRDREAPVHADFRLRGRARALGGKLILGLLGGDRESPGFIDFALRNRALALGANFGVKLGVALLVMLVFGLVNTLMLWLAVALTLGLINFVTSPGIAQRASSPLKSQQGDRRLSLLISSMAALIFGLTGGLGFAQMFEQRLGLVVHSADGLTGLAFGLLFGLLFALPMSGTCWPRYALASLWLWAQRRLPLHLMGFLDDAYRLGLLRIVGPVYQFRHAALQDHLAPPAKPITIAVSPLHPLKT